MSILLHSLCILRKTFFFELLEPEEISYTYKIRPAKDFGVPMNQSYHGIHLVPTQPIQACSPISNSVIIRNNIAFSERGECSFLTKVIHAENAGAIAIIIFDYDRENDSKMVDMVVDGTDRESFLPSFYLMGKDGYMIMKALQDTGLPGAIINIPINATGIPVTMLNQPPWTLW